MNNSHIKYLAQQKLSQQKTNPLSNKELVDIDLVTGKPIELNLQIEKKVHKTDDIVTKSVNEFITHFQAIDTDKRGNRKTVPLQKNFYENPKHGLISMLKWQQVLSEQRNSSQNNIKVMICITVYNEGADQIERTLKGVEENLKEFKKRIGMTSQEVAVVIIFDGIEHINNNKDPQENVFKLFETIDTKNNIREEDSIKHQFNLYRKHRENSKIDIEKKKAQTNREYGVSLLDLDPQTHNIYSEMEEEFMKKFMTEEHLQKFVHLQEQKSKWKKNQSQMKKFIQYTPDFELIEKDKMVIFAIILNLITPNFQKAQYERLMDYISNNDFDNLKHIINFNQTYKQDIQQEIKDVIDHYKEEAEKIISFLIDFISQELISRFAVVMEKYKVQEPLNYNQFRVAQSESNNPLEAAIQFIYEKEEQDQETLMKITPATKTQVIIQAFRRIEIDFQSFFEQEFFKSMYSYKQQILLEDHLEQYPEEYMKYCDLQQAYQQNMKEKKQFQELKKLYHLKNNQKRDLQLKALERVKKDSIKYLKQREHSAWLYQVREERSIVRENWDFDVSDSDSENDEFIKREKKKRRSMMRDDSQTSDGFSQKYDPLGQSAGSGENESEGAGGMGQMCISEDSINEQDLIKRKVEEDLEKDRLNVFYCVKYVNGKKLNSHLWFFKGFCEFLDPKYVMLIDCGLVPDPDALVNFFTAMEADKNIGGVCGFMGLQKERVVGDLGERLDSFKPEKVDFLSRKLHTIFSIQQAQIFEYNFAHIIDKAFESLFGFIHVLPGAFSGYRYRALKSFDNGGKRESILDAYLKTQLDKSVGYRDLAESNMYLAEDRILCLSLFCHPEGFENKGYTLKYIPSAHAFVDPIMNLVAMLGQRRRWINGSWFALNYVLDNYKGQVSKSRHSYKFKFLLWINMLYSKLNQAFTYFAISLFFVIINLQLKEIFEWATLPKIQGFTDHIGDAATGVYSLSLFVYFMILGSQIFHSLQYSHSHPHAYSIYYQNSTLWGLFMWISFAFMAYSMIQKIWVEQEDNTENLTTVEKYYVPIIQYMIYVLIIGHIVPVALNPCKKWGKIKEIMYAVPSFMFYMPSYIHMFIIFAFCRIDDLSWGTKEKGSDGGVSKEEAELKERGKAQKFFFFIKWIFLNFMFGFIGAITSSYPVYSKIFILLLALVITGLIVVRLLGSTLFYFKNWLFHKKMAVSEKEYRQSTLQKTNFLRRIIIESLTTQLRVVNDQLGRYRTLLKEAETGNTMTDTNTQTKTTMNFTDQQIEILNDEDKMNKALNSQKNYQQQNEAQLEQNFASVLMGNLQHSKQEHIRQHDMESRAQSRLNIKNSNLSYIQRSQLNVQEHANNGLSHISPIKFKNTKKSKINEYNNSNGKDNHSDTNSTNSKNSNNNLLTDHIQNSTQNLKKSQFIPKQNVNSFENLEDQNNSRVKYQKKRKPSNKFTIQVQKPQGDETTANNIFSSRPLIEEQSVNSTNINNNTNNTSTFNPKSSKLKKQNSVKSIDTQSYHRKNSISLEPERVSITYSQQQGKPVDKIELLNTNESEQTPNSKDTLEKGALKINNNNNQNCVPAQKIIEQQINNSKSNIKNDNYKDDLGEQLEFFIEQDSNDSGDMDHFNEIPSLNEKNE